MSRRSVHIFFLHDHSADIPVSVFCLSLRLKSQLRIVAQRLQCRIQEMCVALIRQAVWPVGIVKRKP